MNKKIIERKQNVFNSVFNTFNLEDLFNLKYIQLQFQKKILAGHTKASNFSVIEIESWKTRKTLIFWHFEFFLSSAIDSTVCISGLWLNIYFQLNMK